MDVELDNWISVLTALCRRPPCPKCGKKGLAYAHHPHAFGHKDSSRIYCRFCASTFKQKEMT